MDSLLEFKSVTGGNDDDEDVDLECMKQSLVRVLESLSCDNCKKLARDPYNIAGCDCTFCRDCADRLKGTQCPLCREPTTPKECRPCLVLKNMVQSAIELCEGLEMFDILEAADGVTDPSNERRSSSRLEGSPLEKLNVSVTNQRKGKSRQTSGVKINVDKRNPKGETALHVAALKGNVEKVRTLLADGANPNTKDNAGWTPLHEAISRGFEEIVALLIEHGASVNAPGGDNITPLHEAVASGNTRLTELLVSKGADPNARNSQGQTPADLTSNEVLKAALKMNGLAATPVAAAPAVKCSSYDKTVVIFALDFERSDMQELNQTSRSLGFKVSHSLGPRVTHTAIQGDEVKDVTRFYSAILQGIHVVSYEWIRKSLELGYLTDPAPYELDGKLQNVPEGSASRLNHENQLPGLFNGCHFFLQGAFNNPTKGDITGWIKTGGGVVLSRMPNPESIPPVESTVPYHAKPNGLLERCSHFIIYDPEAKKQPDMKYNMSHVKTLSLKWLRDCIEQFQLLENLSDY